MKTGDNKLPKCPATRNLIGIREEEEMPGLRQEMAHTGLAFFRKSQTLSTLDGERPQSLDSVRRAIKEAVDRILKKLYMTERLFHCGLKRDDDIRSVLPAIKRVMTTFQLSFLHSLKQFDELSDSANKMDAGNFDPDSLQQVMQYGQKVAKFLPGSFVDIISDILQVLSYLKKYCLSFYKGQEDYYMETATHYEAQRKDFLSAIQGHVNSISEVSDACRFTEGLQVSHFGFAANELARRCDVGHLPILLAFPQCCENIKNACRGIHKWLEADEVYADFIKHDITTLEGKEEILTKQVKEGKEKVYILEHKIRTNKQEVAMQVEELSRLKPREAQLNEELMAFVKELKQAQMEVQLKKSQQEALRRREFDYDHNEYEEQSTSLNNAILHLKLNVLPNINKRIEQAKQKMQWLVDKKSLKEYKDQELRVCLGELADAQDVLNDQKTELSRVERNLAQLREIYTSKTSTEAMKKIYHNMPVEARNARFRKRQDMGGKSPRPDLLKRAIQTAAKSIENDWISLYRTITFHPPRSDTERDTDINMIIQKRYRSGTDAHALEALEKWRRLHTRASVVDLKTALVRVRRSEIADTIEEDTKRKRSISKASVRRKSKPKIAFMRNSVFAEKRLYNASVSLPRVK